MPPDDVRTPVCLVRSRIIPRGTGLAFMRRDNLIHQTCLTEAQRRAQPPPAAAAVPLGDVTQGSHADV